MCVQKLRIKGRDDYNWVTKVKVEYLDGDEWKLYGVIKANENNDEEVQRKVLFNASAVKIYPVEFHEVIDLRADVELVEERGISAGEFKKVQEAVCINQDK